MTLRKISEEELKKILAEHEKWLEPGGEGGSRAELCDLNLCDVDLRNANLQQATLKGSDLSDADLRGADLQGASLFETTFIATNLGNSNFSESNLSGANLSSANLNSAKLNFSSLFATKFNDTNLSMTCFSDVRLFETIFADVDLSNAKNLDKCYFTGPCIIDFRTLEKSPNLPLSFLRGCGLPDRLIDYLPSLTGDAIEYYSCFISYSTKDQAFAERLYADLQNKGVRCWFAPEDLKTGDKFRVEIDHKIRLHDKLLLIVSEDSINSAWVEKEVETAFEKEQETGEPVLFPIRLDDAVMKTKAGWAADIRRSRHIGYFTKWKDHESYQKAFERLLRDLKGDEEK